ncbi:MAG: cytochrome oxidase putative small subunit CydP [Pseudomonadota bacterium]
MKSNKWFANIPILFWEVLFALLLKSVFLFLLWWVFFSHAPDKQTIADSIAERISGTAQDISLTSRRHRHD